MQCSNIFYPLVVVLLTLLDGALSQPRGRFEGSLAGSQRKSMMRRKQFMQSNPQFKQKLLEYQSKHPGHENKMQQLRRLKMMQQKQHSATSSMKHRDVSELFHFCNEQSWEKTKSFPQIAQKITDHVEEMRIVKCSMYETLNLCMAPESDDEKWSCVKRTCGAMIETMIEKAHSVADPSHPMMYHTCSDIESSMGKIRCGFEQIILSSSCAQLKATCGAYDFSDITTRDGTTKVCPASDNKYDNKGINDVIM